MSTNTAGNIIQSIRKSEGVSQYELALKAGTFQANISSIENGKTDPSLGTIDSCLAPLGYSLIAVPTLFTPVHLIALQIREAVIEKKLSKAKTLCIQINDDLMKSSTEVAIALACVEPILTGDRRLDALIAGICEYRLNSKDSKAPAWVFGAERYLDELWVVDKYEKDLKDIARRTPKEFAARNIYYDERELASV